MSKEYRLVHEGSDRWISAPNNGGECCGTYADTVIELNRLLRERNDALAEAERAKNDRNRIGLEIRDPLISKLDAANRRIKQLEDCLESAWAVISSVSGGNWNNQDAEWREAVTRWRDEEFHPLGKSIAERKAREVKPKRQYYCCQKQCRAWSSNDRNCICWHDEGAGPFNYRRHDDDQALHTTKLEWRIKPGAKEAKP